MNISKIAEQAAITSQTAPKTAAEETTKKDTTLAADNADKFVKSEETFTPAYTKKTAQKNNVETSTFKGSVAETKASHLESLVQTLIAKQSSKASSSSFIDSINEKIKAATGAEDSEKDEDYWGAEATAQRIFDFAKNLAGDDDELFDTLKSAFKTGFGQAEGVHGGKGKLPSVCYDTYSKVMDKFDTWEKEIADKKTADKTTEPAETTK